MVTGWGYGLWAIAKGYINSYISFYVAMGRAIIPPGPEEAARNFSFFLLARPLRPDGVALQ